MPNNIIYEHDYRKEKEERISQTHSENSDRAFQLAQDTGVYKAIGDHIRALPHVLNPRKKEAYEKTLAILERYAAHWGGYIKGTISYEIFDSYLYLDLPFHEFVCEAEVCHIWATRRTVYGEEAEAGRRDVIEFAISMRH